MKYCIKCGEKMNDRAVFCQKCGTESIVPPTISKHSTHYQSSQRQPAQPAQRRTVQSRHAQPQSASFRKVNNRIAIIVICVVVIVLVIVGISGVDGGSGLRSQGKMIVGDWHYLGYSGTNMKFGASDMRASVINESSIRIYCWDGCGIVEDEWLYSIKNDGALVVMVDGQLMPELRRGNAQIAKYPEDFDTWYVSNKMLRIGSLYFAKDAVTAAEIYEKMYDYSYNR